MRVATFNVENLDDRADSRSPSLDTRAPILRRTLERLDADVLCLQEVHGQELPEHSPEHPRRDLSALDAVLAGTEYAGYQRVHTVTSDGEPYDKRNLVILSRYPIDSSNQYRNDKIDELMYRKVTADPPEAEAKDLSWERPILHARLSLPELGTLHVINLHLKSRLASNVAGRKVNTYT